jgi:sirohydrochlorin cobaltochelatase
MTASASLLLVAHGSTRHPAAADGLYRIAERLKPRFAHIDIAFWRQEPRLSPAHLGDGPLFVVPYFAGLGKHTEQLIPERLGLPRPNVTYCPPVGCHPALPGLIHRRALAAAEDPAQTTLLLIGHGSREGGANRTPEAIAETLRGLGGFAEVVTAYLEQAPFAADWRGLARFPKVVAQPLLLSAGMHASDDLPPLFAGPEAVLLQGIGDEAEIAAMILDQIEAPWPEERGP